DQDDAGDKGVSRASSRRRDRPATDHPRRGASPPISRGTESFTAARAFFTASVEVTEPDSGFATGAGNAKKGAAAVAAANGDDGDGFADMDRELAADGDDDGKASCGIRPRGRATTESRLLRGTGTDASRATASAAGASEAGANGVGIAAAAAAAAAAAPFGGELAVGEAIEARFGGKSRWFPGTIESCSAAVGGAAAAAVTYAVAYADGDRESGIPRLRIRRPGEKEVRRLAAGMPVDVRLPRRGKGYHMATVRRADGADGSCLVAFADGDTEWGVVRDCIVGPCSGNDGSGGVSGSGGGRSGAESGGAAKVEGDEGRGNDERADAVAGARGAAVEAAAATAAGAADGDMIAPARTNGSSGASTAALSSASAEASLAAGKALAGKGVMAAAVPAIQWDGAAAAVPAGIDWIQSIAKAVPSPVATPRIEEQQTVPATANNAVTTGAVADIGASDARHGSLGPPPAFLASAVLSGLITPPPRPASPAAALFAGPVAASRTSSVDYVKLASTLEREHLAAEAETAARTETGNGNGGTVAGDGSGRSASCSGKGDIEIQKTDGASNEAPAPAVPVATEKELAAVALSAAPPASATTTAAAADTTMKPLPPARAMAEP
ncbi:unnamed protein product, partial [Phaeothamnion confervicola]